MALFVSVRYEGVPEIRGGRYTLSSGVVPDTISLDLNALSQQQMRNVPEEGTVVFTQGTDSFALPNSLVDSSNVLYSDQGFVQRLRLYDRRWKWQFGAFLEVFIGNDYEVLREALSILGEDLIIPADLREILRRSDIRTVSAQRAVDVLAEGLQTYGLLCYPLPAFGNRRQTSVVKAGAGDGPPINDDIIRTTPSLSTYRRPQWIRYSTELAFRQWFNTVPVLPLDDADTNKNGTYRWVKYDEHPDWDARAAKIQPGRHSLAGYPAAWDSHYGRSFATVDPLNKDLTLGYYNGEETFWALHQSPLRYHIVNLEESTTPQGYKVVQEEYDESAYMGKVNYLTQQYVRDLNRKTSEGIPVTEPCQVTQFRDPIMLPKDLQDRASEWEPAKVWTLNAYTLASDKLRAQDLGVDRMAYTERVDYGEIPNGLEWFVNADSYITLLSQEATWPASVTNENKLTVIPTLGNVYKADRLRGNDLDHVTGQLLWPTRSDDQFVPAFVRRLADARFPGQIDRNTFYYRGLQVIPVSGKIQQISWDVTNTKAPTTTVYVGWEGDPYTTPANQRWLINAARRIRI